MFSRKEIEDILYCRLSEDELRKRLTTLTPDLVDEETFRQFVQVFLESGLPIPSIASDVIDCCGTGGSRLPHFNTSTTVAFILASGGVRVVKLGDRSLHHRSGSTDLLSALGLAATLRPERLPRVLEQCQVGFLQASQYYPHWEAFTRLRQMTTEPTIFNYMGPLFNPVLPTFRLLGVSNPRMQKLLGDFLAYHLSTKRAMVVRAFSGLDELDVTGETEILHVKQRTLHKWVYEGPTTEGLSLEEAPIEHSVENNLAIFNALVTSTDKTSRFFRMVCLNAGAGFHIAGRATSIEEGIALAEELLASGKVMETLRRCRQVYATVAS